MGQAALGIVCFQQRLHEDFTFFLRDVRHDFKLLIVFFDSRFIMFSSSTRTTTFEKLSLAGSEISRDLVD